MEAVNLPETSYQDAFSHCLFDINSGLEFKPVSVEEKKPLFSIFDIAPIEFDMEFAEPGTRLKNYFESTTLLNVLPKTGLDFSEMLSFDFDISCIEESVKSSTNQYAKVDNGLKFAAVDNKLPPKARSGILSAFFGTKVYRTKILKNLSVFKKLRGYCSCLDENFGNKPLIDIQSKISIGKFPIQTNSHMFRMR